MDFLGHVGILKTCAWGASWVTLVDQISQAEIIIVISAEAFHLFPAI